jgi:hypothetical protein
MTLRSYLRAPPFFAAEPKLYRIAMESVRYSFHRDAIKHKVYSKEREATRKYERAEM